MTRDPRHLPPSGDKAGDPCPSCGTAPLDRAPLARPPVDGRPALDVTACAACGDYWIENDGRELTTEVMRALGLL